MSTDEVDLLVVGSGVAGLSATAAAAEVSSRLRVGIITKGELSDSATQWAQGGVAAVLGRKEVEARDPQDSLALHVSDTLRAGAGLCDRSAVEVLVAEGPARVRQLAALGACFDRDGLGRWSLSREGGHSTARVLHAGGAATGAEVERTLVAAARSAAARLWEGYFALELIVEGGRCKGVVALSPDGRRVELRSEHVLLATGGAGQLFAVTTNPPQSTGDGLAMALRAGVAVADVEFVQFHPTALYAPSGGPRLLMSEALRGEGAVLRDLDGRRFVDEMLPRDAVAAAVAERMLEAGSAHVWLDVSPLEDFETRYPTLASKARAAGLDPPRDWLPVAPAAHYMCGGVLTDLDGATTLAGLWAAGEVACSGVHGANRLASNSLLEGMVFGARVVEAILAGKSSAEPTGALRPAIDPGSATSGSVPVTRLDNPLPPINVEEGLTVDQAKVLERLQQAMSAGAGVVRDAASLRAAASVVCELAGSGVPSGELANLLTVARAVLGAASAREESRGGHRRSDFLGEREDFSHRFLQ